MPYDGSGNFTIINNFEEDRVNGVSIDSLKMDNNFNDVADGLSNVMLRSGVSGMTGALNMASHKILNVTSGTASTDAVNKGQLDSVNSTLTALISSTTTTAVNNLLASLFPVGSLYIGTQNTCPLTSLISGSSWELVATDKALWGGNGSNANTTIAAGLPNITGSLAKVINKGTSSGAFVDGEVEVANWNTGGGSIRYANFDASRSSSIYGASDTVQPPAYRVNVWRRKA